MFRIPEAAEEWRQYALSEEQLNFYRLEGYVSGIRLLSDEQVDVLREELAPLSATDGRGYETSQAVKQIAWLEPSGRQQGG
jgi:hypothetical protein